MGKRKNNSAAASNSKKEKKDDVLSSPKEIKKEKQLSNDSDSEPEDYEDEQPEVPAEAEETKIEDGQTYYEPDQLRMLIESFMEFLSYRQGISTSCQNMERQVAEWAETRPEDNIDASIFCADFRKYLKTATRMRNFTLEDACGALSTYLKSEKSLADFKTLPAKPPTKVQVYMKKKNVTFMHLGAEMKKAFHTMQTDHALNKEIEDDIREFSLKYIPQLQHFLDSHPNLTADQKHAIDVKIKGLKKKYASKEAAPKTPKKGKKEPETAFSLFCRSKGDKWRDLSEEDREKKLQKKFAKLSAAERELLEGLALHS